MTSAQDTTSQTTQSATEQHQHHHHHHHHTDGAERYKRKAFMSIKRKSLFGKILFAVLSLTAIALMAYVYWIYTTE